MIYLGAQEYFFYEGISRGFNGSVKDISWLLKDKFAFDNQVSRDCLRAFKWGFCLGLILTYQEYIELTTYKSNVTLITNVMEDQMNGTVTSATINDEDLANTNLTGVC